MYKNNLEVMDYTKWNKKILNIYWVIAMLATLTEIVIFLLVAVPRGDNKLVYIATYIIKPTIISILLLAVSQLIYNYMKDKFKEAAKYFIVIVGTLLAFSLIVVHYSINVIYVLFLLPIMLSIFYGSNNIAIFSLILNLTLYLLYVIFYLPTKPSIYVNHNLADVCTTIAAMISTELIVSSFIRRHNELSKALNNMYETERDLTLKNFVMEINSRFEPLTGLYNHKTFYENLENLIEQSENFGYPLSLALMDIDDFKGINDTYGHATGDKVIIALSDIIKESLGTDEYAARYGGDEFAIIFTNKDKHKAYEIMEEIRRKFNHKKIKIIENKKLSISVGISQHNQSLSIQSFFAQVDSALYSSKRSGKNRTMIYDDAI